MTLPIQIAMYRHKPRGWTLLSGGGASQHRRWHWVKLEDPDGHEWLEWHFGHLPICLRISLPDYMCSLPRQGR